MKPTKLCTTRVFQAGSNATVYTMLEEFVKNHAIKSITTTTFQRRTKGSDEKPFTVYEAQVTYYKKMPEPTMWLRLYLNDEVPIVRGLLLKYLAERYEISINKQE